MTAAQRIRSAWPPILIASALLAGVLVFADVNGTVRLLAVLWFLLVCPGVAIVRLLDLEDLLAEVTVGVGLSAALAIVVSGVMLYAHAWSPEATLAILLGITIVAALADMKRHRRSVDQEGDSA
jgi:hypothetical protein